jgi:hypothetical protein
MALIGDVTTPPVYTPAFAPTVPGASSTALSPGESAALAQIQASMQTSSSSGQVYFGNLTPAGGGQGQSHDYSGTRVMPTWLSIQAAEANFGTWTQKQINDFTAVGIMSGQLKVGDGQIEAAALWSKLVKQASIFGAQGQQVSPFDVLNTYVTNSTTAGVWKKDANGYFETNTITGERRYIGPEFRTINTTQVNLTDPTTAKAIATNIFHQLLGRDPLPGEMNAYASALQTAEQSNPTQIATTNQYDAMGNVIATTKQTAQGGYSADAKNFLAAQQAKALPEYGATQAATTYENAFENAVFGAPK